jgi:hypothetical protein
MTSKVCPAIVISPLRTVIVGFAVTLYVTVPFPDPDAPPVIEIHVSLSLVDHAHPEAALTEIVFVDASGPTDANTGEMV